EEPPLEDRGQHAVLSLVEIETARERWLGEDGATRHRPALLVADAARDAPRGRELDIAPGGLSGADDRPAVGARQVLLVAPQHGVLAGGGALPPGPTRRGA